MMHPVPALATVPTVSPIHLGFFPDGNGVLVVLEQEASSRPQMRWIYLFADRASACSRLFELGLLSPAHADAFSRPSPDGSIQEIALTIRDPKRSLRDFHMSQLGAWS